MGDAQTNKLAQFQPNCRHKGLYAKKIINIEHINSRNYIQAAKLHLCQNDIKCL